MTYLVMINNDTATIANDSLILTDNDIYKLSTVEDVIDKISTLRKNEEELLVKSKIEAYKIGYKEGLKKAQSDLSDQFVEYLKDLTENIFVNTIETNEEILNLACEVTRKIANDIGPRDMLISIATTAINKLKYNKYLEIKVKPEYVSVLQDKLAQLIDKDKYKLSNIDIKPDASLGDLDCVITSDSGETVASFDDQLCLLKKNIEEEMCLHN